MAERGAISEKERRNNSKKGLESMREISEKEAEWGEGRLRA